jgi:cellulose synthase/poly-beta-1,6-N-acetylglucosamine synthase-like glycosyltransferase
VIWLIDILLVLLGVPSLPVTVVCVECAAAFAPVHRRKTEPTEIPDPDRSGIVVLIPACNEERTLGITLESVLGQMTAGGKVVVVADNCTDSTAKIARDMGAVVCERHDSQLRGKGYALDFGIRFIEELSNQQGAVSLSDPKSVLIIIDADCVLEDGAIDTLASEVRSSGQPVQALYLLERPRIPTARSGVSMLAFLMKNRIRPRGLSRMGLPCLLTGSGMAFPASAIQSANLANGHIVEDLQLSLTLSVAGYSPRFCEQAHVKGSLPPDGSVAFWQRARWEHGHLQVLLSELPRVWKAAIIQRRPKLFALGLELAVPPLALLSLSLGASIVASSAIAYFVPALPLARDIAMLLCGSALLLFCCVAASWFRYGREAIPFASLLSIPLYIAWKIPIYFAFPFRRLAEWNKTPRHDELDTPPVTADGDSVEDLDL